MRSMYLASLYVQNGGRLLQAAPMLLKKWCRYFNPAPLPAFLLKWVLQNDTVERFFLELEIVGNTNRE